MRGGSTHWGSQVSVSSGGSRLRKLNIRRNNILKRPLNIRWRDGRQPPSYGIAIDSIVSRLRSSQWRPFLALRSPIHPPGTCPPSLSLFLPRYSRVIAAGRVPRLCVSKQDIARPRILGVPRTPNNCKNTHTGSAQCLREHKRRLSSPFPSRHATRRLPWMAKSERERENTLTKVVEHDVVFVDAIGERGPCARVYRTHSSFSTAIRRNWI